jgi:Tol biopolymer transport system component
LQLSPDGARFAYVAESCVDPAAHTDPSCGTLWVRRLDGRDERRVSPGGAVDIMSNFGDAYTWSPDGRRIAYAGFHGLVVVDILNGRRRLLSTGVTLTPDWSAVGRLLFTRGDALVTSAADGSGRRLVRGARNAFLARWSPDGMRIAYIRAVGQRWLLFVSRPDGSGCRRLGDAQDYQLLQWSGDGRRLLLGVAGGDRFEIFAADGGGARPRFVAGGDHGDWRAARSIPSAPR